MKTIKDSSIAIKLIEPHLGDLLRKKKFTEAMEFSSHLQKSEFSDENYKNLAAIINIQCVTGSQKWDKLKEVYTDCIKTVAGQRSFQTHALCFRIFAESQKE